MKKYLKNRYSMSDVGAKNLVIAIFTHTLNNLSKILPPMFGFIFLDQFFGVYFGTPSTVQWGMWQYLLTIGIMFIFMFIIGRIDYMRLYPVVYQESKNYRIDIANRLKKLPLAYFGKRDIADLSATIMSDLNVYEELFSHAVPQLYATVISTIILSAMIIRYNVKLGLAVFCVIPFAYLIFFVSRKFQKASYRKGYAKKREIYDSLQEGMDSIQEIKSYGMENSFLENFKTKLKEEKKIKLEGELSAGVFLNFAAIVLKIGIVAVALVGAKMFIAGEIPIITYAAYLMLSMSIYNPISDIFNNLSMLLYLDTLVTRLKEIKGMPTQEGTENFKPDNYDVGFENVRFSYDDNFEVIRGVSFVAKQGETTALVGPSGSGKTTLTKLAARFWDINEGKITLGSTDISGVDPETLLKSFSIVFQDVTLFNASIMDNIRIGRKDASDEDVLRVSKLARCDEFVQKLPDGYNTLIGENGEKLSGGERQRISIARAILKDAPVILLDEATASLDVENESLIQEALSELVRNKTVIIIAHRMRTVAGADKIVVLKNGKIEETGSPNELLEKNSLFKSMMEKQSLAV
ncbi:ABC transporter ATP-binding protein [Treponema phagedenis]|uniref:ABC transporter ATP-binding protein n=1 Tax=Treponema phagedenis TaxID=162 RepID=A0A0B7GXR8_TREPH|nr:ABC transporter ATP-binding protein [Treponema phagedenis]NVP24364.1 ABC transporter ATP-binding protein [Treponema phagedenis]QEJ96059.1 ABC transporter ATP-binding protein [Treponema phagedenis]QEJ99041.1 ABC transporter ATP-binding protein [Treponema phagedenis]QEK01822.1 ABC transporter ATP-binding protein [Treponema phagedenis]QEK04552.1 ABC transporter ATP-binding protein [Treponema phagedenis]